MIRDQFYFIILFDPSWSESIRVDPSQNFAKGFVNGFLQKSNTFSWLFFGQIKPEEIVFDVFDRKECFLNQKSKVFKKAKKSKFFKGVSLKKVRKIKIFQRG